MERPVEVDLGDPGTHQESPSRNQPPLPFRTALSEYPYNKEFRYKSIAIKKCAAKRKAERARTGSLINLDARRKKIEEGKLKEKEKPAPPEAMSVVQKDTHAKNLLWKKLSVGGLQEKAGTLFSIYPITNERLLQRER